MAKTIFVAVIGVLLIGLCIWIWRFDNCETTKAVEEKQGREEGVNQKKK